MEFHGGQRAKLAPELGGAAVNVVMRTDNHHGGRRLYLIESADSPGPLVSVSENALRPLDIEWRPGDVVVVTYGPGRGFAPYTYVRGVETWPVDKGRTPKTDEWMNQMYAQGKVTPKLQAGGAPFDPARLPGAPRPAQGGIVTAPSDGWRVFKGDGVAP